MSSGRAAVAVALAGGALTVGALLVPSRGGAATTRRYREGDVVAVDALHGRIVVHAGLGPGARDIPVTITPATTILLGERALPIADVRRGDHATVRFQREAPIGTPGTAAKIWIARADVGGSD